MSNNTSTTEELFKASLSSIVTSVRELRRAYQLNAFFYLNKSFDDPEICSLVLFNLKNHTFEPICAFEEYGSGLYVRRLFESREPVQQEVSGHVYKLSRKDQPPFSKVFEHQGQKLKLKALSNVQDVTVNRSQNGSQSSLDVSMSVQIPTPEEVGLAAQLANGESAQQSGSTYVSMNLSKRYSVRWENYSKLLDNKELLENLESRIEQKLIELQGNEDAFDREAYEPRLVTAVQVSVKGEAFFLRKDISIQAKKKKKKFGVSFKYLNCMGSSAANADSTEDAWHTTIKGSDENRFLYPFVRITPIKRLPTQDEDGATVVEVPTGQNNADVSSGDANTDKTRETEQTNSSESSGHAFGVKVDQASLDSVENWLQHVIGLVGSESVSVVHEVIQNLKNKQTVEAFVAGYIGKWKLSLEERLVLRALATGCPRHGLPVDAKIPTWALRIALQFDASIIRHVDPKLKKALKDVNKSKEPSMEPKSSSNISALVCEGFKLLLGRKSHSRADRINRAAALGFFLLVAVAVIVEAYCLLSGCFAGAQTTAAPTVSATQSPSVFTSTTNAGIQVNETGCLSFGEHMCVELSRGYTYHIRQDFGLGKHTLIPFLAAWPYREEFTKILVGFGSISGDTRAQECAFDYSVSLNTSVSGLDTEQDFINTVSVTCGKTPGALPFSSTLLKPHTWFLRSAMVVERNFKPFESKSGTYFKRANVETGYIFPTPLPTLTRGLLVRVGNNQRQSNGQGKLQRESIGKVTTLGTSAPTPRERLRGGFVNIEERLAPANTEDINGYREIGDGGASPLVCLTPGTRARSRLDEDFPSGSAWDRYEHSRYIRIGDVNGDGMADIVETTDSGVYVWLATGSSFKRPELWVPSHGIEVKRGHGWNADEHPTVMTDVDGDGRLDIVGFGDSGVDVSLASNGSLNDSSEPWVAANGYEVEAGYWHVDKHPRFVADVNGDGKADIVVFGDDGVYVSRSSNDSFKDQELCVAAYGHADEAGGWRVNKHLRLIGDVNGDGKADVVGFGNDGVYVSLSLGGSSFKPPELWVPAYGYSAEAGGWRVDIHPRFLADVNGDGKADIVGFGDAGVYVSLASNTSSFEAPVLWANASTHETATYHNSRPRGAGIRIFSSGSNGPKQPAYFPAVTGFAREGWDDEKAPRIMTHVDADRRLSIEGICEFK